MRSTLRPRTGTLSTFTSSSPFSVPPHGKLPSLVKRDRHGRQSTADRDNYPFADLNEEDSIAGELALAPLTLQGKTNAGIPHRGAVFHLDGECLSHPQGGCNCEAVQRPVMDQHAMWVVLAHRFKSVYAKEEPSIQSPALCAPHPTCTNALQARHRKPPIPRRATTSLQGTNAPPQERHPTKSPPTKSVEKVLAHHLARTSGCGPAVLAVPARVARRVAVAHESRTGTASRQGGARNQTSGIRDSLPLRRVSH
ncbi:hypothetical protein T484DRAFT_1961601 [Baffinella frigidus]|nr:hypothetical protein T484DRAFT_1961601 [Cryptophyta sp. CCMP2293]